MKKLVIAGLIASSIGVASAAEVGLAGGSDFEGPDYGVVRADIKVDVPLPLLGAAKAGLEYTYAADRNDKRYDQYALVVTKPVATVAGFGLALKAGAGYLKTADAKEGAVGVAGFVVSAPVSKTVSVEFGAEQRWAETAIRSTEGAVATLGLRVKF